MKAWLYVNKLDLSERHSLEIAPGLTLHEWVAAAAPDYQERSRQPISIWVNGQMIPVADWPQQVVQADDRVEVYAEPAGKVFTQVINTIFPGLGNVFSYVFNALIPKIPRQEDRAQGSSIYDANLQGNRPRLGGTIPELAGQFPYFPDHISNPRRYYVDNKQYLDLNFCIGRGWFDLPANRMRIANSSMSRWAGDVVYQLSEPGQSVTAHPAHRNWYTSPEVDRFEIKGAEVKEFTAVEGERSIMTGEDDTGSWIIIRDGSSVVEPGWNVGARIEITGASISSLLFEGVLDVVDGGDDGLGTDLPDIVRAPYNWVGLTVGQAVEFAAAGPLAGAYVVRSISGRDITLEDSLGDAYTGLTPATGVLTRIYQTGTVDGLYDVTARNGELAYVSKVGVGGWPGFGADTVYETASLAVVLGGRPSNVYGPYAACPPGVKARRFELDFERRGGWGRYTGDGSFVGLDVDCEIQWRDINEGGAWNVIPKTFSGKSVDALGETMLVELSEDVEPEFQVVRLTGAFGSTRYIERLEWAALKAELDANTSYEFETTLQMTIKSSSSLSGTAENKMSVEPTRKLQVLLAEGVWSTELVPTRDISAFWRYVLISSGYTDEEIDQAELWRLHQIWSARGDTFDGVFDNSTTLYDALKAILLPGFAEPTQDGSKWVPVRDEAVGWEDVEQQFGPHVQLAEGFEIQDVLREPNSNDGVDVEYMDPITRKPATVECRLEGDLGTKPLQLKAFGVISRVRAYRIGMRERLKQKLQRRTMKWNTTQAGLNVRYRAPVSVADNEPGWGSSGAVASWNQTTLTLTLSAPLLVADGETGHVIALRRPDGSQHGPVTAIPVGEYTWCRDYDDDQEQPPLRKGYLQVQIPAAPDFDIVLDGTTAGDPTYFLAGTADTWCYFGKVIKATPQGTGKVAIEALEYADIYQYDDAELPEGL